jgi:hypothetical protein
MELPFAALVGRQIGPQGAMAFPSHMNVRPSRAGRPSVTGRSLNTPTSAPRLQKAEQSMRLSAATFTLFIAMGAPALAQMTVTPGPGGIPIAPGLPVPGYTPGGIGPGGTEVAPGAAARDVPMYRIGPGGIPFPPRPDPRPDENNAMRLQPGCGNGGPCEILPQNLALTITSRDAGAGKEPSSDAPIDSIHDLFTVLRACWEPPAREQAQEGVQMSVRFSFKRTGEIVGPPFVTYTTPGTKPDTKQVYRRAINTAIERCVPLRFSKTFAAAIAGQPISIRYVDDRIMQVGLPQP